MCRLYCFPKGVEVPIVQAEAMRMGGGVWKQAELVTFDFSGRFGGAFAGILGRELFSDVLLTLDHPEQQIRLEQGSLAASDAAVVSYTTAAPPSGPMCIDVDVAGTTIPFDLDTGSPLAFTLPYHMRDSLPLHAEPVEAGQARLASHSATLWNAQLAGTIAFAGLSFDDPTMPLPWETAEREEQRRAPSGGYGPEDGGIVCGTSA